MISYTDVKYDNFYNLYATYLLIWVTIMSLKPSKN